MTGLTPEEAASYCEARGARLPHTMEWQYAAQGPDGFRYPWGNVFDSSRFPAPQHPSETEPVPWRGPAAVDAFAGASPFGMRDVVGNAWEWTASEFVDAHTRRVVVRGGSSYVPLTGGAWTKWSRCAGLPEVALLVARASEARHDLH